MNVLKAKCKRCVAILSLVLMLMQTSYGALEGLQSSLNHDKGTIALSCLYISYMLSSLLLPPLFIEKLKCRKTLALSIFTYTIYIAANFYPQTYILIPAAMILGVGSGLLWSTVHFYVMNLSVLYSKLTKQKSTYYTTYFYGIIYAFTNIGSLSGAVVMSVLLNVLSKPELKVIEDSHYNVTSNPSVIYNLATSTISNSSYGDKSCGLYYAYQNAYKGNNTEIEKSTLYVLLSVYIVLSGLASILCLFLTEFNDVEHSKNNDCIDENVLEDQLNKNQEDLTISNSSVYAQSPNEKRTLDNDCNFNELKPPSSISLVKSVVGLLMTDKVALLFVIFTVHVGILKAFARATFNAAWVSCWLGIQYVGYLMTLYSSVLTITSYLSGLLLRCISHRVLFGINLLIEITICLILLYWEPTENDVWVYFVVMGLFAVCYGLVKTQTPSAYSAMFVNKKAAGALVTSVESIGLSLMFGLSGNVYPIVSMVVFCVFGVLGYAMLFCGFVIKHKKWRYWSN